MIGMPHPILPIETKKTLKDVTQNVLNTLFVPVPEEENNIQFRSAQVFGTMGSGKTSVYRFIGKKAIDHYGEEQVNALVSTNLDALISNINDKPVQLLCLDDAGLETQDVAKELVSKFTHVRHIFEEKRTNGVVIVMFAVQDYFLLEKKLRSTLHVEIFKHAPTNKHDVGQIKGLLGDLAMKVLETISKKVFEEHKYKWLSTCIAKTISGRVGCFFYDFIPAKESVLREIEPFETIEKDTIYTEDDFHIQGYASEDLDLEKYTQFLTTWKTVLEEHDSVKNVKGNEIDALIGYLKGIKQQAIGDEYGVSRQRAGQWIRNVKENILGTLTELFLIKHNQKYANFNHFAGQEEVDLIGKRDNATVFVEVKARSQRESKTVKWLCNEMKEKLVKGVDGIYEVCQVVVSPTNPKIFYYNVWYSKSAMQAESEREAGGDLERSPLQPLSVPPTDQPPGSAQSTKDQSQPDHLPATGSGNRGKSGL